MKLSNREFERAVGMLAGMAKIGPAVAKPFGYRVLQWLGVLKQTPWTWQDSERLDGMPWGRLKDVEFTRASLPDGLDGPWPQAPIVNEGFSPPILNVGAQERWEHVRYNITRYLGQILLLTPGAAYRALKGPRLDTVDDAKLASLFESTSFAQFICPRLDPQDLKAFHGLIPEGRETRYMKIDFSAISLLGSTLPDIHVAPTVSLVEDLGGGHYRFKAIRLGDKVITPSDGTSWTLAKYFVLQGAQIHMVTIVHPRLHFPQDAINAITKTMLPREHIVFKLLRPHGQLTLGLHESVIHHRRSVLQNSQREIYTPFPFPAEGVHKAVAIGMQGLQGNSAYPVYRFGNFLTGTHTRYGVYREEWFQAVLEFTSSVVAHVPQGDPSLVAWANQIHGWLAGFPDGTEIFEGNNLAQALAQYICAVSIFHTADHYSFTTIPLTLLPWRLHIQPPDVETPGALNLDALVLVEDFFRQQLCYEMFFKPIVLRSLTEADYEFKESAALQAEGRFRQSMKAIDAHWAGSTFPASGQIAVSLQY